jgi:hypothetical protein
VRRRVAVDDEVAQLDHVPVLEDAAIIAEKSGTISFGRDYKNKRRLTLTPHDGSEPVMSRVLALSEETRARMSPALTREPGSTPMIASTGTSSSTGAARPGPPTCVRRS